MLQIECPCRLLKTRPEGGVAHPSRINDVNSAKALIRFLEFRLAQVGSVVSREDRTVFIEVCVRVQSEDFVLRRCSEGLAREKGLMKVVKMDQIAVICLGWVGWALYLRVSVPTLPKKSRTRWCSHGQSYEARTGQEQLDLKGAVHRRNVDKTKVADTMWNASKGRKSVLVFMRMVCIRVSSSIYRMAG